MRLRCPSSKRRGGQAQREHREADHDGDVTHGDGRRLRVCADLLQRLQSVAGRQHIADPLQPVRQYFARHDDAAQQQLRSYHHRHELHGLKLGAGERTTQQSQADAQHGVDDRDGEHQDRAALGVKTEEQVRNDARQRGLCRSGDRECRAVRGQQVEPAQGSGEDALQRARNPFSLHRYRRDQKHHNEREHAQHDQAGVVERRGHAGPMRRVLEHEVHQRDDQLGTTRIIATLR